ncbi:MAG: TIR domain-containing protein [Pseudomonadota bacterium]
MPAPAYTGKDPYVFVSYAHGDGALALDEISWLQEHGVNIWYDEGITPGANWTDVLAEKIEGCALVLYFVSEKSVASEHCRNEIHLALELNKSLLAIHFEPAELPPGQRLTLSSKQALIKFELPPEDYGRKLLESVSKHTAVEANATITPPRPKLKTNQNWLVVSTVLALSIIAIGIWFTYRGSSTSSPETAQLAQEKAPLPANLTLLISDLENQTAEPLFNGTVEDAIRSTLEQARFIDALDRRALRQLSGTVSPSLSTDTARLLASREGIDWVVTSRVSGSAGAYELKLTLLQPLSGAERAGSIIQAATAIDLIRELSEAAKRLRVELGDIGTEETELTEHISSDSIEAIAKYVQGQQAALDWQHDKAIRLYEEAIELDPEMGRAYSGLGLSALREGQMSKSRTAFRTGITKLDRLSERERLRTVGVYYAQGVYNYDKAIETYEEILEKYPADSAAANNLAVLYLYQRNFAAAAAAGRTLVERFPNATLYAENSALFSMYAGDFAEGAKEGERTAELSNSSFLAYLPIVVHLTMEVQYAAAEEVLRRMSSVSRAGMRRALLTTADLEMLRGDYVTATKTLEESLKLTRADNDESGENRSLIWLAKVHTLLDKPQQAQKYLAELQNNTLGVHDEFQLGGAYLQLGDLKGAETVLESLENNLEGQAVVWASRLKAQIAIARDRPAAALAALREVESDAWYHRLLRGQAYVAGDRGLEALDDFDHCWAQSGEASSVFMDDITTMHMLVEARYWQTRAADIQGISETANATRTDYLRRRDLATDDPRVLQMQQIGMYPGSKFAAR